MTNTTSLKVLSSIKDFIKQNGFPPSVRDIMDRTNIRSTSVVTRQLKKLAEEGYIHHTPEVARGIVLRENPQTRQNNAQ